MIARKSYKFRLYPTRTQVKKFEHTLDLCRELYNAALQERRDAYKMCNKSINLYDQQNQLPAIKEVRPDLLDVYAQTLQDVLSRLDKAFKAFFSRVKNGDKPGFPRFQGRNRYDSFTYPQHGWSLKNNKLTLSKIGTIKVRLHREVVGKVKTCSIKRDGLDWYVVFSVEYEFEQPQKHEGPQVGIDVGLEYFASYSDGNQTENPRHYRKAQKNLTKTQRHVDWLKTTDKKHPRKIKAKKAVTRAHKKIKNQRMDFHHKLSTKLVKTYSLIVVENLQVKNLSKRAKPKFDETTQTFLPNGASAKSGLNKSIVDAGWSTFINMLSYKVDYTGSKLIKVRPNGTSQTCPDCGNIVKKELSERWHSCECGCSLPRDVAAAKVILRIGQNSLGIQSVNAVSPDQAAT
jgi:putative transposase